MKKFLVLILLVTAALPLFAAEMIITENNGNTTVIPIDEIQSITFSDSADLLTQLVTWMSGSFSSEAQADTSSDPYHYDVRLKMVRIWDNEPTENGYWLYVEQAYAEQQNSPYRQRIYRVFEEDGVIKDEIFTFPNPSDFVGSWATPDDFNVLNQNDLTLKVGCGLFFLWEGNHYSGSTQGEECTSSIPNVSYITSQSDIYSTYLTSWDLGYNANGQIVMGPYSPYIFDKLEDYPINY